METTIKQFYAGQDEAGLQALKDKHGPLNVVWCKTQGGESRIGAYLKTPDRTVYEAAFAAKQGGSNMKAGEVVYLNCRVAFDPQIDAVPAHYVSICLECVMHLELTETGLEKA